MAKYRPVNQQGPGYVSKKCHGCYTYVPLEADVCPSCKIKLGNVDEHGMAGKVTDWKAYTAFAAAFVAFLVFCRYAFF